MIWVRRFFGLLFLIISGILVASIVITFSQLVQYFTLLSICISQGCDGDRFKDILLGLITYGFMAFMVYYLARRGLVMLAGIKPEEPEENSILDEADFSHTKVHLSYFQTRYGYCHVLPDRILFTNTREAGDTSVYKEKRKVTLLFITQFIVICAVLFYIYTGWTVKTFWQLLAPVLVVFFSLASLLTSFRDSTTAFIPREKIVLVSFVKGIPYFINPHFIIWFNDSKNRKRKRVIQLTDANEKTISEALLVFRNASLMVH